MGCQRFGTVPRLVAPGYDGLGVHRSLKEEKVRNSCRADTLIRTEEARGSCGCASDLVPFLLARLCRPLEGNVE